MCLNSLVFTVLAGLSLTFPLQMYWFIAKTCFILGCQNAIKTVVVLGSTYLVASHWSRPRLLARVAEIGIDRWLDPNYIFFNQLAFYVGASSFTLLFALLVIAEQKSRLKAEALTKQVETLAATLERTRIARNIHDSLGHSLTTLDVHLELAQRLYHQDSIQTEQSLQTAKQLAQQCLTEVRRSVQTIREETLNLNEQIATLTNSIDPNHSLTIQLDLDLPPLPSQIGHQLYCILQEGLTNVQKHAEASNVILTGKYDTGKIRIELHDDGIGFNRHNHQSGYGHRGIYERTQILGGVFTIQSYPGEGTTLQIVIPYPSESS
ncbi:hypothetical protein AM10699_42490 [Acaryochloris marina MBIC10699]|nr:hypothetical protein AM10699_42490 [Acaryochloris marina MBIC10699]